MQGTLLGNRLGRQVQVAELSRVLEGLSRNSLSHAVVLFWVRDHDALDAVRARLDALVASAPLAVFAAGPEGVRLFDALLQELSQSPALPQIMTRHSEAALRECVEEFLQATWPSEDRIDAWTAYLLVSDDPSDTKALSGAAVSRL